MTSLETFCPSPTSKMLIEYIKYHCSYCECLRTFYRYPQGTSRMWVCMSCAHERKYDALLQSSIQHSEVMMNNYVNEAVSQDLRTKLEESTKRS